LITVTNEKSNSIGVRSGTARHPGGKATAKRIISAAREVLTEQGQSNFSMRNVAELAGLHLANVQYYFPKRDDLARALLIDTGERYRALYDDALELAPADPVERFKCVVRVNLDDIMNRQTRQFFIQFWSLLDGMDRHSGRLLGELYAIDIQQLSDTIGAMHPRTGAEEIERRATLLAAMIEGLMVVRGAGTRRTPKIRKLLDQAYKIALAIANGDIR